MRHLARPALRSRASPTSARVTALDIHDIRFPTSRELDGSDAMTTRPPSRPVSFSSCQNAAGTLPSSRSAHSCGTPPARGHALWVTPTRRVGGRNSRTYVRSQHAPVSRSSRQVVYR